MFEPFLDFLGLPGASSATPPVIGISGGDADSASVRAMMTQIHSTGAIPIFLGNHANRDANEDIGKIDALVVMGNNADLDPASYGQQRHAKTMAETDTPEGKARAEYETQLMTLAMQQKMPVLGVCGGMQRLNVLAGGTLNQSVADITGNDDHDQRGHNIAPFIPVQLVKILPNTLLSVISSDVSAVYTPTHAKEPLGAIAENSMHHQCVDKVGDGLRVCGASIENDKHGNQISIPEAIEADPKGKFAGQFLLGLQWHPEFSASPIGKFVAERVAAEGVKFAKATGRSHPLNEAVEENIKSSQPQMKDHSEAKMAIGGFTQQLLASRDQGRGAGL